jgi:hypothetical protein
MMRFRPGAFGEEAEDGFWAAFTRLMIRTTSWFLLMTGSYPRGFQVPEWRGHSRARRTP